jgi:hypothetical protein
MVKILGFTANQLIYFTDEGIRLLRERCGIKKDSGFLTVFDKVSASVMLCCQIQHCPKGKADQYFTFSMEKARRLQANPDHYTSFQSRDEKSDKYAGAILCRVNTILSFSGLPELADEALMIFVAFKAGWIDEKEVLRLSGISQNPYVEKITKEA